MEKRHTNRITPGLKAEILSGDIRCEGVIENLSEDGMFVVTKFSGKVINFTPGTTVEVKFQFYSEETIELKCIVRRAERILPHGLTSSLGLEIIDPPWKLSD